jgi:hypothetical protein
MPGGCMLLCDYVALGNGVVLFGGNHLFCRAYMPNGVKGVP